MWVMESFRLNMRKWRSLSAEKVMEQESEREREEEDEEDGVDEGDERKRERRRKGWRELTGES